MAAKFIRGLELAGQFYVSVLRPVLDEAFPGLRYSAALLGPGSEVLGFDSERSTDHDWGPRLQVLLTDSDARSHAERITQRLAAGLPATFRGYPTFFAFSSEPASAARHHVQVSALGEWLTGQLGFDPRNGISTLDWLATPTQRLAEITSGAVFHDGLTELTPVRESLAWYPRDIWLYVLACHGRQTRIAALRITFSLSKSAPATLSTLPAVWR